MQQFDTEKLINNQYKLMTRIGRGSFGEVYKAINVESNELVGVKLEPQDAAMPQLKHEYTILSSVQGNGLPKVYWYGTWEDKTVMVMELLGYNIEELFNLVNRNISLKSMLMLIDQMIDIISIIHSRGYLYRDIKPENFVMGLNKKNNTIFIVDFGLSKRYKDKKTNEHIPYRENKGLVGTARYVSLNTHLGIEQTRRDDMESLGYLWLYCLKGKLPWQGLDAQTREEKYDLIRTIKQSINIEDLCLNLPAEFTQYFKHCRCLKFEEEPDYKKFKMLFRDLFFKLDFVWDYQFEWSEIIQQQVDCVILNKQYSKNSLSSLRGGSQFGKSDEDEDIKEKIEFKISDQTPKVTMNLDILKSKPNLFQSIFK